MKLNKNKYSIVLGQPDTEDGYIKLKYKEKSFALVCPYQIIVDADEYYKHKNYFDYLQHVSEYTENEYKKSVEPKEGYAFLSTIEDGKVENPWGYFVVPVMFTDMILRILIGWGKDDDIIFNYD